MPFYNCHFMNKGGAWETICQPSRMCDILLKGQLSSMGEVDANIMED
jgi:hypothetical protein